MKNAARLRIPGALTALVALACLAAPNQAAPNPPEDAKQPLPVFGAESSLVLLDVVARDKKGSLVRDLTANDFEVYEDGRPQDVVAFNIINNEATAGGIRVPSAQRASGETAHPAPVAAPAGHAPGQGEPAVIAFVFDRLSTEGRDQANKAAHIYLSKGYVPGDVVGVFVVDQTLHTVLPFSTDLNAIRGAFEHAFMFAQTAFATSRQEARGKTAHAMQMEDDMNKLQAMAGAGGGGSQARTQAAALGAAIVFTHMQANMARTFDRLERDQQGYASTNGLLAVVSGLKALPGRKTVVFFSEGLTVSSSVEEQFRSISAVANRANVSVYAVDAGGLRVHSGTQEAREELNQMTERRLRSFSRPSAGGGALTRDQERAEDMLRLNPAAKLGELAADTGGFLVTDTNDATDGFRRIQEEMRFYYLLSYAPSNSEFDGTYRSISVKVKRKGIKIFARKGYLALPPLPSVAAAAAVPVRSFEAPAVALLDKGAHPSDFPIWARALSFPEPARRGRVPIMVGMSVGNLTFQEDVNDKTYEADFSVVASVRDAQGTEVDRMSQHYPLGIPADKLAAANQGDVLFFRETDLAPGSYTVDAVAYDAMGKKASVQETHVEVPAVHDHGLALSSLAILKRVEKLSAEEQGGDNPFYVGETFMYPDLGAPLHKSTSRALGFFFTVYSPDPSQAPTAMLELEKGGQVLAKLPLTLATPDSNGRIQHAAAIPMDKIEPGEYTLKVTVASAGQTASRQTHFVVES